MKYLVLTASLVISTVGWAGSAMAEDASWGCQVLLCAASQNPSWHGVSYCVPPMRKLISAMAKPHFSWPICEEANSGKPGRQDYEDCPAGFAVGYSDNGSDRVGQGDPNICVKTINQCANRNEFHRLYGSEAANEKANIRLRYLGNDGGDHWNSGGGCMVEITAARPRRADPYYFDIPDDKGLKQRFWFNLKE